MNSAGRSFSSQARRVGQEGQAPRHRLGFLCPGPVRHFFVQISKIHGPVIAFCDEDGTPTSIIAPGKIDPDDIDPPDRVH